MSCKWWLRDAGGSKVDGLKEPTKNLRDAIVDEE
jgi:hypothetical protein